MPDTDDTDPGAPTAEPPKRREGSVRTSLDELRRLEEQRLEAEEAEELARQEAARLAREQAERRDREAAAERTRQEAAVAAERQRAEAAAAERARLLDVDRRLAEQERALRAEFELERTRLTAELERARTDSPSLTAWLATRGMAVAIGFVLLTVLGVWALRWWNRQENEAQRVLVAAMERTRYEAELKPLRRQLEENAARISQIDRALEQAQGHAMELEAIARELQTVSRGHAGASRPGPRSNALHLRRRPDAPPRIEVGDTDDPIEGIPDDPPDDQRRKRRTP